VGYGYAVPMLDCPHADRCAGCPTIQLDYALQLERKAERVRRAVARYPALGTLDIAAPVAAEPIAAYRVRAKLIAAPGGRLGLFAQTGDHEVVDIPQCRVLRPIVARAAQALRELMAEPSAASAGALVPAGGSRSGGLRAVDLREVIDAGGQVRVMITLVLDARLGRTTAALEATAAAIAARVPEVASISASFHEGESPQVLGRAPVLLWGEATVADRVLEREAGRDHAAVSSAQDDSSPVQLLATAGSFVQVHRGQAARICQLLADWLSSALGGLRGRRIVDAFAGSGPIGLVLAARGARVMLIESLASAVSVAERAAADQGWSVHARAGDAAEVLADLVRAGEKVDAIVCNPPRRGLSTAVRRACSELEPRAIAYVSCDPDTLARDLADFARLGWRASRLLPHDMMPHTEEVETVALLERSPTPLPRVLLEEQDLVAVDKPAHEPTTPQGESRGSLLERVRSLPGFSAAVPVHRLDAGTSGVCLFAKTAAAVTAWAAALGADDAVKEYLALCRGITRPKGSVSRPLRDEGKDREARTRYQRIAVVGGHSLLRIRIEHGRTHQIRRHLASLGHPVLGDLRHGHAPSNRHLGEKHGLDRPFLHCARICLLHPRTGATLELQAELAGDLRTVLDRMGAGELEI
jgi:23S rRNA (uracil1939-C5)-methyltransferase